MKKFFTLALALLISVAFVTTVFAQGPTDTAGTAKKSGEKKAAVAAEKAPAGEKAIQKAEKPATTEKKATTKKATKKKAKKPRGKKDRG
jgi:hypothetical protein